MRVTREDIQNGLAGLGVVPGDVLLAHSSLKSFGHVVGGADAVIDALLESVGTQGTVMVPTLTFQVLNDYPVRFSVSETPSTSGWITDVFRLRPESLRSSHPVSSAAAIGPQAKYLTGDHSDTPCDASSPYFRLAELGGKVVFFGASLGSNTLFHCAEDIVQPPYLGYATISDAEVVRADGSPFRVTARRYDCADRGVRRYLANMEPVFLEQKLLRKTHIGNSRTYLIDGRANIECSAEVLRERPEYILKPLEPN